MELNEKIIVGLDIGTTKICAIVGKKNAYGKVEVLGMGKAESFGVMRGVVANIDKTVQSIIEAISEASNKSGVNIQDVYVGIAGQHIKSMQHRGMRTRPNLDQEISQRDIDLILEDMTKLAMPPGEEIIHIIPQEFIIDNEQGIKEPIGMLGSRLEVNCHIVTGLVTAARNIQKCVSRANLNPVGLILEPIASAEAVLTNEEKEAGVVLVDIGGGTTDIAIFHEGLIRHTAVIPFGGNVITEDIREGCSIIRSQAELLKIKFGIALASQAKENEIVSIPGLRGREPKEISVKNLANIIQARMEEIIEQVYYEIKNSGWERKLIGGIVVTGGGSQLKHIVQLIEFITGMDTRLGEPNEHLAKANEEIQSPMYSTSVGLVLQGFNEERRKEMSQVSEKRQKEKVPVKKGPWFKNFFADTKEFLTDTGNDNSI
ncbi:MAG TPA: cell division protein FtsA [Bacteroidia bacterium]|nr:cell division protein FtsA [Bacteroidia bacterium]HNT79882.1 cell division protein FtsA [Bacteroidia bacterium]